MTAILGQAWQSLRQVDPSLESLPGSLTELKEALSQSGASDLATQVDAAFSSEDAYSTAFEAWSADFSPAVGDMTGPYAATLNAQKNAWIQSGRPVVENWRPPSQVNPSAYRQAKAVVQRAATFVGGTRIVNGRVRLSDGSTAHLNLASPGHPNFTGDWVHGDLPYINISADLEPPAMERELARLIGEMDAHVRGTDVPSAGLRAQMLVHLDQYFMASPSEQAAIGDAVETLFATPEFTRLFGAGVDPTLEAQLDKFEFVRHDLDLSDTGAAEGVRLHGSHTKTDANGVIRNPGHIMATHMRGDEAIGEHFSFGPVTHSGLGSAERADALEAGGVNTRGVPLLHDRDIEFFRGARVAPLATRKGMLYDHASDGYVKPDPQMSFGFDPDFIPPDTFNTIVNMEKALEESDPAARDYVLATTETSKERVTTEDVVKGPIQMLLSRQGPRQGLVAVSEEEDKLLSHAHNCVTTLIGVLRNIKNAQGNPVLDSTDLAMLGLDSMGQAPAGRDLRPQDLFLHLRWKEAAWKQTHH